MKLLTRYSGEGVSEGQKIKRARFVIRIPYYCLLAGLGAVYYGYVISLCLKFLILQAGMHRTGLAFIAVFHGLYGMMLWCLLTTVARGPGFVGEELGGGDLEGGPSRGTYQRVTAGGGDPDIDAGMGRKASLSPPSVSRRRGSSRSTHASGSSSEEGEDNGEEERDYLEMRPAAASSDEEDSSDDEDMQDVLNERGRKVAILYPGDPTYDSGTLQAKENGKPRFCRKCNVPKPDRAHHCSTCGFCILKMDHHCPWIGGCVGFKNYKPFILFLLYADLVALWTASSSIWTIIQVLDVDIEILGLAPVAWGFLVLFGFLFAMMLTGFFPYHVYLAVNNRTTIENMERNGRLLSLPARAEAVLSAGVPDPRSASLPEQARGGPNLLSHEQNAHSQAVPPFRTNPFLADLPTFATAQTPPPPPGFAASASSSLSRIARRQMEKRAGRTNIYDLGLSSINFEEAFGRPWYDWRAWVPIGRGKGTGYSFPVNEAKLKRLRKLNRKLVGSTGAV